MKMDRVSVVIPAFNAERTLRTTVESVLAQTHQNLEIVVVDDGSTDGTVGVIQDFINEGKVRYIRRENGGAAAARNTGLLASTGEYIALLDGDDLWDRDKIERQLQFLHDSNAEVVFCDPRRMTRDGKVHTTVEDRLGFSNLIEALTERNMIYTSSILFRRSVLDRVGLMDEDIEWGEEWDWWIRAACSTRMMRLPVSLVTRRVQPSSFSTSSTVKYKGYARLYEKHVGLIDPSLRKAFKRNMGNKCYTDAHKLLKGRCRKQAVAAYRQALKLRPMLVLRLHKLAWDYLASFW